MTDPLEQFCQTPYQRGVLQAVNLHGSQRKAAKALGKNNTCIDRVMQSIRARAVRQGYSPEHDMTHPAAPGFAVKGTSTLYSPEGEVKQQWVKTDRDSEQQLEIHKKIIETLSEDIKGLAPITKPPKTALEDILAVYPIGDPHTGLYVWAKECGADFDLVIGRRLALGAVDRLVSCAPEARTGIVLLLGDVYHMNDQTNQTPAHKFQLDVDSRFVKVLQVGIETYRHTILRALQKHQKVIVRCVPGNHDPQSIWALAFTLAAYFSNEPRVEIDLSPAKHWYYRFGLVLLGSTHGESQKPEQLPAIMACDRPEDWGLTKFRYWLTGHIHSSNSKEFPGVMWESFRTMAAPDVHTTTHGYRAGRDMRCIVYHKDYGEVERHRCDVAMLESVS